MNMSQMVDYLIKYYSEKDAFVTASHLKSNSCSQRNGDTDSLQVVNEKKTNQKKEERKKAAAAKKAAEDQKIKEDLLAMYEQHRQSQNQNRGQGRGRGRGNRGNRGGKRRCIKFY